jgi:hypothetical protein
MQKACTHDAWDDTLRACLATGGGAGCFDGSTVATASAWGFPALGVEGHWHKLPAECDEFRRLIEHYSTCKALPQEARDALTQSLKMLEDEAGPNLEAVRSSCAAGAQALQQISGC